MQFKLINVLTPPFYFLGKTGRDAAISVLQKHPKINFIILKGLDTNSTYMFYSSSLINKKKIKY